MTPPAAGSAEKETLRQAALKSRDSLTLKYREAADAKITRLLLSLPEFQRARRVMLYASFRSEAGTGAIISGALEAGKEVVLPLVNKKEHCLKLYAIGDASDVRPGCMGIPEPPAGKDTQRDIADMDVVVMPAVVLDRQGGRIGYGGGYYDRLLGGVEGKGVSGKGATLLALAYGVQMTKRVPIEAHDVRVDAAITEEGVIWIKRK